jgi:RNA polymerase sigma factor (sigma-70 family)
LSDENGGGSTEDQRMADALREAGQHVFAYLYETFGTPLYDYCEGLLQDSIAAADAVQDSLVAVDARVTSLPEPGDLRVALYSDARRQCMKQLPSHWGKQTTQPETPVDEFAWDIPEIEAPGAEGEKLAVVMAALARLPDRDREVLNLAFRHQVEGAELAAVLGRSPRRVQTLLAEACGRFTQSAAAVVALRAGRAGCAVLADLASGQQDPASIPLASKLGQKVSGHVESCADCARSREGREFPPELISEVPLATPPVRLRLRINRTALALGEYRHTVVKRSDDPGDSGLQLLQSRTWRGMPRVMVASSAAVAVLAVPGVVFYRIEASSAPHPVSATVRAEPTPTPIDVSTLHVSPELHPLPSGPKRTPRRHRHRQPSAGASGSAPGRVLPSSGTTGSSPGGSPGPGPTHSHPPSPKPSSQPTTAPASPSPSPEPSPTPTLPLL